MKKFIEEIMQDNLVKAVEKNLLNIIKKFFKQQLKKLIIIKNLFYLNPPQNLI